MYSYKQLCELTGAEYLQGNSRKRHLEGYGENGFHRFFDFEKSSYGKYSISKVYDEPLPMVDERKKGNRSIYSVYIELLLMNHLSSKKKSHTETFMRKDLWKMLGMINEKYITMSDESLLRIDKTITNYEIADFRIRCNQKLESIIKSALNSLKARFLIDWEMQTIISKLLPNGDRVWVEATDEDKKEIIVAKRQVLGELNCDDIFSVYSKRLQKQFNSRVNELLNEKFNWDYFFKRYKVIFDAKNIREAIPETEVILNKLLLNNEIVKYLNNEAKKNYENKMEIYERRLAEATSEEEYELASRKWKPPVNYILAQALLTDELIKIDGTSDNNKQSKIMNQIFDMAREYEDVDDIFTD